MISCDLDVLNSCTTIAGYKPAFFYTLLESIPTVFLHLKISHGWYSLSNYQQLQKFNVQPKSA